MPQEGLTLEQLGWDSSWEQTFVEARLNGLEPGRVAIEDKQRYGVYTRNGPVSAKAAGRLMHKAAAPEELPKVGDWIALTLYPNEGKGVIQHVLPRRTKLSRKVTGRALEEQVLVCNVDVAFVVQALDPTFNPRLLERMLAMVHESGARPVVVLNKSDLHEDIPHKLADARQAAGNTPVIVSSAKTGEAITDLQEFIPRGQTVVFIGPSGVGKSSLINRLYGEEIQATAEVRVTDAKGRHTTAWRELIVLPGGGIVIDTPGMREFQIWLAGQGIHEAFPDIEELGRGCQFRDCSHTHEKKCAVLDAVATGQLPRERYDSFLKLERELAFLEEARKKPSLSRRRKTKVPHWVPTSETPRF